MKTTIDFPDDLLHRAKIVAAQRKITLKDIVLQGVDYVITHRIPAPDAESERKARAATLVEALSRGQNTEPVGRLHRDEIYGSHEDAQRKVTLRRLLAAMKAANTEPMVPLTREEIYAER